MIKHLKGFTLIELLVVISIIAVLSTIGTTIFRGVGQGANDAAKRSDVDSIATVLEGHFNAATSQYPFLQNSWFVGNKIPNQPGGAEYEITPAGLNSRANPPGANSDTGFLVCAPLSNHVSGACSFSDNTCLCKESSQARYIAASSPSPSPSPSVNPSPSGTPPTSAYFRLSKGFIDNVPRQITRANNNKLYIFAGQAESSNVLRVHYTTTAGFPTAIADFSTTQTQVEAAVILSVDTAYDGGNIIHVFMNMLNGNLIDHPYDITTNTFKAVKTISSGNPIVAGNYLGTTGVSSMIDSSGKIHIAYWAAGNQIMYKGYTYNSGSDVLTQTDGPTRVDTSGSANHPELVVSPVDQSVTVAWVSEAIATKQILARSRTSGGVWGSVENASNPTVPVWISTNAGINIDQGPVIVITADGTKHLIYIENFGSCPSPSGDYGRLHYVSKTTAGSWVDQSVSNFCTHAPGIGTNSLNEIYVIGHGYPNNPSCTSMLDICIIKKNGGVWTNPLTIITHPGTDSLDASVSVKWSAVGWNAPETLEFALFSANNGSYQNTDVWYGRYVP